MERLQQLIELATLRGHLFTYDLFKAGDYQEKRYAELTKQITPLAESLSIFDISEQIPKLLSVMFSDKEVFETFANEPVSELTDDYIFHSQIIEIKILDGKITKKLKLLYLEEVQEHEKTQAI